MVSAIVDFLAAINVVDISLVLQIRTQFVRTMIEMTAALATTVLVWRTYPTASAHSVSTAVLVNVVHLLVVVCASN